MDVTPIERKPTAHEAVSAENRSAALLAGARADPTRSGEREERDAESWRRATLSTPANVARLACQTDVGADETA